jgi:hypothetical protein
MSSNYSILINTTDSFEDCWIPFFTLFKKFWPEYDGKIYLNTETKEFSYPGLNIISIQNSKDNPGIRITWSECLLRALNTIDTEIILYMQEDYFLKDFVKNDIVEKYVQLMQSNSEMDCIHLTDQGSPADKRSNFEHLYTIPQKHQDRICCQAALWKRDVLKQYPRTYETAWNFEWWGSKRASILKHNFYVVDKTWVKLNTFEIIPYIFTAVIGGRWFREVVPLCEQNNITIDYSKRGFFERKPVSVSRRIKSKIKRLPVEIRSYFGLILLKLK